MTSSGSQLEASALVVVGVVYKNKRKNEHRSFAEIVRKIQQGELG